MFARQHSLQLFNLSDVTDTKTSLCKQWVFVIQAVLLPGIIREC